MWKWWIEGTKLSIFAILSNCKKGSKKVQLVSTHCNKMSWIVMWHVLPPTFKQRLAKNQVVAGCVNTHCWLDKITQKSRDITFLNHFTKILATWMWRRVLSLGVHEYLFQQVYISFDNFKFEGKDQLRGRYFTLSLMLASDWAQNIFWAQSRTSIRISRGTGSFRVASLCSPAPSWKPSPQFFLAQLTASGSPRMCENGELIWFS